MTTTAFRICVDVDGEKEKAWDKGECDRESFMAFKYKGKIFAFDTEEEFEKFFMKGIGE